MKLYFYQYMDIVYNSWGQLCQVLGFRADGLMLIRRVGFYGYGDWATDGYGYPVLVQTWVNPKNTLIYHA